MKKKSETQKEVFSIATVEISCSNPYSIPSFEDFINEASKRFDEEANAKNRAYSFILSHGLLDLFNEFCKTNQSDEPRRDCVKHLLSEI